jgi:hypothetical protein
MFFFKLCKRRVGVVFLIAVTYAVTQVSSLSAQPFEGEARPPRSLEYPRDALKPLSETIEQRIREYGYLTRSTCDPSDLSLRIEFSDYTIDRDGTQQSDGGWTSIEREVFSGFLCRMLPILDELYGPPFERYTLTLVRDLYNTLSSVFIPRTRSILLNPRWNPQLLTHELIHAFRGDWTLTTASNYWRYDPKLSGFEEGFAQAASYEAMNQYIDTYGADLYVSGSWNRVWLSETSWAYDFFNDSSMITEDFWSDGGGTRKVYERYEQAAAAIRMLAIQIPDFYRRFNEAYYREIRQSSDFLPSKTRIENLIQSLTGRPLSSWFSKQKILSARKLPGKKVWMSMAPSPWVEPLLQIHFLETFPSGSEWAHNVGGQGYLLHRLNRHVGALSIRGAWNQSPFLLNQSIQMRDDPRWGAVEPVCYLNCAHGIGAEQILLHQHSVSIPPTHLLPIRQPSSPGLYELSFSYRNPHFSPQPAYGISYDALSPATTENFTRLLGVSRNDWNQNRIFGGVLGLASGTGSVFISHSEFPQHLVSAPIVRGVFQTSGHSSWRRVIRSGAATVAVPGVLSFRILDSRGRSFTEERVIDYGFEAGKQKILLQFPPDIRMARVIKGPE